MKENIEKLNVLTNSNDNNSEILIDSSADQNNHKTNLNISSENEIIIEEKLNNKAPAIIAILGFINVPIVKFSVNIWNSLHQPASVFKIGGPSIHSSMLLPLMLMFCCFSFYFITNLLIILKTRILEQKLRRNRINQRRNKINIPF